MEVNQALWEKYEKLKSYIKELGPAAVAFSGGVDSTLLLYAAREVLGDQTIALTATSDLFPKRERKEAEEFCEQLGIRQEIIQADELSIEGFAENPKDRCYICKLDLFRRFLQAAAANGMSQVLEGSNLDDNGDFRPGMQAIAQLDIKSPLRYAKLTKAEIRALSEHLGLPTWDKQSFACLASRFPYGNRITKDGLNMVDRAEQLLLDLGFRQLRVRAHDTVARIELLPQDFQKFMKEEIRLMVQDKFKEYGFQYVTLDLEGYRTGSMNEVLQESEKKQIIFRKATEKDIPKAAEIYQRIHEAESAGKVTIGWQADVYPVQKTAEDAWKRGDLFVAEEPGGEMILATAIINQAQVDCYSEGNWEFQASDDEVMVLHTLTVDPLCAGKGAGKAFVQFYENYAKAKGCRVLRMDTNARNEIARKMYASLGYREADIVPCVFNGIPGVNLVLIEKKL